MRITHCSAARVVTCLSALLLVNGCDGGGGSSDVESGVAGRNCTVELRPVMKSDTESVQKQRSGTLQKLTANWVCVNEGGNEIWIPRDMVLEIRMEKK